MFKIKMIILISFDIGTTALAICTWSDASKSRFHLQSQDSVLSQMTEEAKQMKQDVQRAQSLFTSAERELRYEKEKSVDLKRHNALLEQEKLKVGISLEHVANFLTASDIYHIITIFIVLLVTQSFEC